MTGPASRSPRTVMIAIVMATVSTVFPGFLIGAVSVQVSSEFEVTEAVYGWGLGSFFLAATAGSVVLGRLAQVIGPRRQIIGVLLLSAAVQLVLAAWARSWAAVVVTLAACGLANAANQTAVNLALTESQIPRLGLGIAVKQSSMPGAALLSGLTVPALALTVGWRWAYVLGAVLALVGAAVITVVLPAAGAARGPAHRRRPTSSPTALAQVAVGSGLLAFCAGALAAWVVASGVDAGLSEGVAGLMLSVGAAVGIALRLMWGRRLDALRTPPLRIAAFLVVIGAFGYAGLTVRTPLPHVVATLVAFGAGWVWPIFTNYGVVRANRASAAAATGVTQMGVYVGVFSAPLVTGWVIEGWGYPAMWWMVTVTALVGAGVTRRVSPAFAELSP